MCGRVTRLRRFGNEGCSCEPSRIKNSRRTDSPPGTVDFPDLDYTRLAVLVLANLATLAVSGVPGVLGSGCRRSVRCNDVTVTNGYNHLPRDHHDPCFLTMTW